jgi:hypothetical protein
VERCCCPVFSWVYDGIGGGGLGDFYGALVDGLWMDLCPATFTFSALKMVQGGIGIQLDQTLASPHLKSEMWGTHFIP